MKKKETTTNLAEASVAIYKAVDTQFRKGIRFLLSCNAYQKVTFNGCSTSSVKAIVQFPHSPRVYLITIDGKQSDVTIKPTARIGQGSHTGLIVFNLMVNDFPNDSS